MKNIKTSCRICSNCGFDFDIEGNEIIAFKPDVDHPVSEGYFCPKGIAGIEKQKDLNSRLTESLRKNAAGQFEGIDSQLAVKEIADKLSTIIEEHGPRSVAMFFGTGAYLNTLGNILSKSWVNAIGTPNFFSTLTIDQSSHNVTMARMGAFMGGKPEVPAIDVSLIAGTNPLVSHFGYPMAPVEAINVGKGLKAFKERGKKLIVVDPRKTETARNADLHLQIIPGEDVTLYAGLVHLLFKNEWVNREFCDRFVEHVSELEAAVSKFTPDYVAERAGIPVKKIEEAAYLFGTAKKPSAAGATGIGMTRDSNLADFLLESMNVLCGAYRRAGDKIYNPGPLSGSPAVEAVLPPNRTWEHEPKCRSRDAGKIAGEFPSALLPDEILHRGKGKIRALIVVGGNPAMSIPDTARTLEAFDDLDLLVTLDHRETETARLSDYVIATSMQYERMELNSFMDIASRMPYVQLFKQLVEKPEAVLHDWEVFWELGRHMNLQLDFKFVTTFIGYWDLPRGRELDMQNKPDMQTLCHWICEEKDLPFEELFNAERGLEFDMSNTKVLPSPGDDGARMDICPADIAEDIFRLIEKPYSQDRYRLAVRRLIGPHNSAYRDGVGKKLFPQNFAYMHPEDMLEEGLSNGALVDISTATGSILGVVSGDSTLRSGVISMSHCFGNINPEDDPSGEEGGHTNRLIPLDHENNEKINFMAHMTGIPVSISLHR